MTGAAFAFAALCLATAWLEVSGNQVSGLWFVVVVWALFGDFDKKPERDE